MRKPLYTEKVTIKGLRDQIVIFYGEMKLYGTYMEDGSVVVPEVTMAVGEACPRCHRIEVDINDPEAIDTMVEHFLDRQE